MMNFSSSYQFDIIGIYRQFCEIKSGNAYPYSEVGFMLNDDSEKARFLREATVQLSKVVERSVRSFSILNELQRLMSHLNLREDSAFSTFYDFVFFICRESGQKNITVSRALAAWKIVLSGRFRLLDQWCDFVEKNQRYNIPEDTWRQVLSFSRNVHENLEGYDPEGAWPTLIDDFVEHMYRITGSNNCSCHNLTCDCGGPEGKSSMFEEPLQGLKHKPGLKRKSKEDLVGNNLDNHHPKSKNLDHSSSEGVDSMIRCKRQKQHQRCNENPLANATDEELHTVTVNSLSSPKCLYTVESCLAKGFSSLFSSPRVQKG